MIEFEGQNYEVTNEPIKKGDLMLVNNPHPLSDIKNWVRKCYEVIFYQGEDHYTWFNETDKELHLGHTSHMYPKRMCQKLVK